MAPVTGSCLVCDTPATKSCSVCKTAFYCNAEHQKMDWRSHKEYCNKIKAATNTYDAILFATNETKPRLVKIPWEWKHGDEDDPTPWQSLDRDIWFKHTPKSVRENYIGRLGPNGPPLGRTLCYIYDDNFSINGSPINRCILNATGGKAVHTWCGNILALREDPKKPQYSPYNAYANVDMEEDLKPFLVYFETYGTVM